MNPFLERNGESLGLKMEIKFRVGDVLVYKDTWLVASVTYYKVIAVERTLYRLKYKGGSGGSRTVSYPIGYAQKIFKRV